MGRPGRLATSLAVLAAAAGAAVPSGAAAETGPTSAVADAPPPGGAEYVLEGHRWPDRPLTWGFQSLTPDLAESEQRGALSRAFASWAAVSGLSFTEVPDCARVPNDPHCTEPDLRVLFDTDPGHVVVDGVAMGANQGHAFSPPAVDRPGLAGDIHLNDATRWTVSGFPDLESLALHEAGHALGLRHADALDPGSRTICPTTAGPTRPIMCPVVIGTQRTLAPDDIAAIRALYGPPAHGVDSTLRRSTDQVAVGDDVVNTTGAGQSRTTNRARTQKAVFFVQVGNDGAEADVVTVRGPAGPTGFRVRYFVGTSTTQVTDAVTLGTHPLNLEPGATATVRIEITVSNTAPRNRSRAFLVQATSQADPTRLDVVKAVVHVT